MYKRALSNQEHSFFLFGPRATGKSTWLKQQYSHSCWFDLLLTEEFLRLSRDPASFRNEVLAQKERSWIVVDEVQRIPQLLNEVQWLIANHGDQFKFALSGSSARKLKRLDSNLLAGRVFNRSMFPLTVEEIGSDFSLERTLQYGCLPKVYSEPEYAIDILDAYTLNYLQQEIQQEALTKDVGAFSRFLEIAAIMNGQIVNIAGIGRDAGIARTTVQRYFDILVDTLIGTWLEAWKPRLKVKEVAKPKFFFFDPGVSRAAARLTREPLEKAEKGALLETLVLHELSAWNSYLNAGGKINYWRTPSGKEIDFVWSRSKHVVGIEVKAGDVWRREWGNTLKELHSEGVLKKCYVVYLGDKALVDPPITVLPFKQFALDLAAGKIFSD